MKRLTTRREDGRIETRGISYSEFHMDYVPSARINDYYDMRLAAYEDTGLTPEEVAAANERAEKAEADNAALLKEFEKLSTYESLSWLHDHFTDIILRKHPGAELLERVKVLERALEIACKYTECPYTDSMGSALPCDNNDLNCPQCFIAQAKEGRP
jgi:hypothetical protein